MWTQFSRKEVFCEACRLAGFVIAFLILFGILVLAVNAEPLTFTHKPLTTSMHPISTKAKQVPDPVMVIFLINGCHPVETKLKSEDFTFTDINNFMVDRWNHGTH